MIKTTTTVRPFGRNPQVNPVYIYAEIIERNANDSKEFYRLKIQEFYYQEYEYQVLNETTQENETVIGTKKVPLLQPDGTYIKTVVYSFNDANQLSDMLDQMYTITELGAHRRKRYAELGHLFVNNQDQVYGTSWELVE